MKVCKIQDVLGARLLSDEKGLEKDVDSACGCDLMSDVLAFIKHKAVLLTGLVNAHVIRTADMLDVQAIVFVRGKVPPEDLLEMAAERDIAILTTDYTLYEACGMLYREGLPGGERMPV